MSTSSNFENNAFTDFAPLLTLFGDEFTKQFLATSMGWADDILLGIAPIGIITIVVCAIRIGGNKFLRSLIGRARDSPDDEEKEILSSTSDTVREIWNGQKVVRQTGESKTKEILYDSAWTRTPLSSTKPTAKYVNPVISLAKAVTAGNYMQISYLPIKRPKHRDAVIYDSSTFEYKAPNLTLNIDKAIPAPRKVFWLTCLGLLIQAMVMAYNATAVYHFRWLRAGSVVSSYAYPVWAVGTSCLSLGVSLCARVIQDATEKYTLAPYISMSHPKEDNKEIQVSVKAGVQALSVKLTMFGAFLTVVGFVFQNIGTRELHWSAGVAQLGATLFLAAIRALLRSHVGEDPEPKPLRLSDGVESNILVTNLESSSCRILGERISWGPRYLPKSHVRIGGVGRKQLINKDKQNTDNDASTADATQLRVLRMLVLQHELLKWLPEREEVLDLTNGLCKAMEATREFLLGSANPKVQWTQYMIRTEVYAADKLSHDDNLDDKEEIVDIELLMDTGGLRNAPGDEHIASSYRLIQSMISLSWHYYNDNKLITGIQDEGFATIFFPIFWILSSGTQEEIRQRKVRIKDMLKSTSWARDIDNFLDMGNLDRTDYRSGRKYFGGFGMAHSSLLTFDPEGTNHELVFERLYTDAEANDLPQLLAMDMFSNFLKALIVQYRTQLSTRFPREFWKMCLENIGGILSKHGVCSSDVDEKLAILPALLAMDAENAKVLAESSSEHRGDQVN